MSRAGAAASIAIQSAVCVPLPVARSATLPCSSAIRSFRAFLERSGGSACRAANGRKPAMDESRFSLWRALPWLLTGMFFVTLWVLAAIHHAWGPLLATSVPFVVVGVVIWWTET